MPYDPFGIGVVSRDVKNITRLERLFVKAIHIRSYQKQAANAHRVDTFLNGQIELQPNKRDEEDSEIYARDRWAHPSHANSRRVVSFGESLFLLQLLKLHDGSNLLDAVPGT